MSEASKVLITGAAGLLGCHLSEYLVSKGYAVWAIDNLSGGYIENIHPSISQNNRFYNIDLVDSAAVLKIMNKHKFDYVYHFAAYAAVGLSPFIRNFNYQNNILSSINLINSSIKTKVKKFIFASSMDVYGEQIPPFTEDMIPQPLDPYGIAKYAVEMDLVNAKEQFGLDFTVIRPHNIVGIKQDIWDKYRNVIGIWIRKALSGEPLTIYGDGNQKRSFSDVKFYMDPFERVMTVGSGEIINIGAEGYNTINEVCSMVETACIHYGINTQRVYLEPRHEVKNMWCDHSKAKDMLGFKDNTDLQKTIYDMLTWASHIKPKPVKTMEYEINKGMYSYWK